MEGIDRTIERPPRRLQISISLSSIFSIVAVGIGLWLLAQLWQIVIVLVIALVLAGTISPVITRLERRKIGRGAALALILLALVAVVIGTGFMVIPALARQVAQVTSNVPAIQEYIAAQLEAIPALSKRAAAVRAAEPEKLLAPLAAYGLEYTQTAAEILLYGLTIVVLAFYLVADRERVKGFAFALLPRRYHLRSAQILLDMERVVGGYVRGQLIISAAIGVFTFVLLRIVGTPNPLAIAIFAGMADLIPFVGPILALLPATVATLPLGLGAAGIVFIALFLYQQFEGHLLIPRIYGQTLHLSSAAVVIALLVGGKLLGIVGALLALPIAAGLRVLVEGLRIELPGEQPAQQAQRILDARAEARYAAQTAGVSAVEAAEMATDMAERIEQAEVAATGRIEIPAEERTDQLPEDPTGLAKGGVPQPSPYRNPAQ